MERGQLWSHAVVQGRDEGGRGERSVGREKTNLHSWAAKRNRSWWLLVLWRVGLWRGCGHQYIFAQMSFPDSHEAVGLQSRPALSILDL